MNITPGGDFPKVNGSSSVQSQGNKGNSQEKIQRLRDAISSGTYQINVQKIAENITKSGILEE